MPGIWLLRSSSLILLATWLIPVGDLRVLTSSPQLFLRQGQQFLDSECAVRHGSEIHARRKQAPVPDR